MKSRVSKVIQTHAGFELKGYADLRFCGRILSDATGNAKPRSSCSRPDPRKCREE